MGDHDDHDHGIIHDDHEYDNIILIAGVIGIVEFICITLFWFCHLKKNKDHPIYRIRQPIFWVFTMCIIALVPIWRAITIWLWAHNYVHRDVYASLESWRSIVLTFGFVFVRFIFHI